MCKAPKRTNSLSSWGWFQGLCAVLVLRGTQASAGSSGATAAIHWPRPCYSNSTLSCWTKRRCFLELLILVLSSSQHWCSRQRLNRSCFLSPVQACSSLEPTETRTLIRIVSLQFKQYLHKQRHPTCLSCSCMYFSDGRPFVYVTIVQWGRIAYKSLFGFISWINLFLLNHVMKS